MADKKREVDCVHEEIQCIEIEYNEIEIIKLIGKGSFGSVYKALWRNKTVAVKELSILPEKGPLVEVRYLSRVQHRNIIGLYGTVIKGPSVSLVMEYAEDGSLYNLLHCSRIEYSASHAMSWCRQCADGVAYLHAMRPKPLIHRDLKPPNLLLVNNGLILKICDFGTVTDKSTLMTNNKGSAAWMAPEVFEGSIYSERCDVFSWSIILWECLGRELPFKEIELTYSIMWCVHKGQRPHKIDGLPKPINQLMVQCWDPLPQNRPSMDEVHERMKILCDFFPDCEPLNMFDEPYEDEESNLDTYDFDSIYWPTEQTDMPQIRVSSTIDSTCHSTSRTPTQHLLNPMSGDARWSSGESGNPRIVSLGHNGAPMVRGNSNNSPMAPLNVDIDPNAWDLKTHDLQRLVGGDYAKNQGIAITKNTASTTLHTDHHQPYASSHSPQSSTHVSVESTSINGFPTSRSELDIAMLQILDPHLRPIPPANDPTSQKIYKEHMDLAQEYFKTQTEIAYLTKHTEKILHGMQPEERQCRMDICNKLKEKESLLKLELSLRKQLEKVKIEQDHDVVNEDGFCVL
ncbi:unnamed protein product [Chironomus riparius]|uniref:Mitogen-activated protein kinase kinase kinase 7 n=1 Tax=Chironomus riparius TaxID=315576 RepID=A0A9N9S6L0_9DIPT|nr:unnamed protein product [Chironomus riparius]